jgi:hypothetical protein
MISLPLFADIDFITYTETFTHLGTDGGDPEYVFAEFIEGQSLYRVEQKFNYGTNEFFEKIIVWDNLEYHYFCQKIYNNVEYRIKLFKNRLNRKKSKPKPYVPNPNPETIIVDINGTGNYTTIQEGIDNSQDGDIVLVYPGTYFENIDYIGKNITVASKYYTTGDEAYINNTIIDGNNNGSCVVNKDGGDEASICGFTIQHGSGYDTSYYTYGGGIYIGYGDDIINTFNIMYCNIHDNEADNGGGIFVNDCLVLNITDTRITHNFAHAGGGGIAKGGSNINVTFSDDELCDIYMNYAPKGSDIYNHVGNMTVYVDTFTVNEPDKFYVYSRNGNITITVNNHKIEQINNNLYVSPNGNNSNNGLNWNNAFLNIFYALIMVKSDSTHSNKIYVDEGIYSPSLTGDFFALGGKDHISLIGAGKENTILDAEQTGNIFEIGKISNYLVEKFTLTNGYDFFVGGIDVDSNSLIACKKLKLINNNCMDDGVTHLNLYTDCEVSFKNVEMISTYEV